MSGGPWHLHVCDKPTGTAQVDWSLRGPTGPRSVHISEHVLRLAQTEYERQHGDQIDYERMQERDGLSVFEVIGLLADYVERLGGKPTSPRVPT